VIAGALLAAYVAIHARFHETLRSARAQEQVIQPKPGIARPAVSHVVPKCVHGLIRIQSANGIEPTLIKHLLE
jgi:hypothetical protein